MFEVKKFVAPLLFPVPLCLEVLLLGLFLLWFTQKHRTGKVLTACGVLMLALLSYVPVSNVLLAPLEHRFPPLFLSASSSSRDLALSAQWVVVLGGGLVSDPELPTTSQLTEGSLVRLIEGIRLYRQIPGSKLLLSGGAVFDRVAEAEGMAEVAQALGVNRADMVLETESRDTADQARLVQTIVGHDRMILVTSASTMRRAIVLFEKRGVQLIPAPTGHLVKQHQGVNPELFFPSATGLRIAQTAAYEYLGLGWAWMSGQS